MVTASDQPRPHRDHHAHTAAVTAGLRLHPELTRDEASAEAINAVAFASSFHSDWFWAPLRKLITEQIQ